MRTNPLLPALACVGLTWVAVAGPAQHPAGEAYDGLAWRMIGPFRGGRTRAVAGVPLQPNVFYIGAVNGGVWKTDDAGRTWQPIFDAQPTQSIGAIAVAPSDPDIVYVASGEGLLRPDLSVGDGIYRSSDGGRTWSHLGLADGQQIPELAVDPRDPDRLFAAVLGHPTARTPSAASTARWTAASAGNGSCSTRTMTPAAPRSRSIRGQPEIVYAALWQARLGPWEDKNEFKGTGGGLFKSTDGGTHLAAAEAPACRRI